VQSVLHLIRRDDYEARAGQEIVVPCLPGEFVHCTGDAETLREVANAVFGQSPDEFLVLELDPSKLGADLRWEPPEPPPPDGSALSGQLFPHLYGSISRDVIVEVRPARRGPTGEFLET